MNNSEPLFDMDSDSDEVDKLNTNVFEFDLKSLVEEMLSDEITSENDEEYFMETQNANDPATRGKNLLDSLLSFRSNREVEAVYYQTVALAKGFQLSYNFCNQNNMLNEINAIDKNTTKTAVFPESKLVNDFLTKTKEMPKEWTIIQMSREYNPLSFFQTSTVTTGQNSSIFLSAICYSKWELNDYKPICVKLDPLPNINIFTDVEKMIDVLSKLFSTVSDIQDQKEKRQVYSQIMNDVEASATTVIGNLKKVISPWICFFQGKLTNTSQIKEDQIHKKITQFVKGKKYTKRQITLIFLLLRSSELVNVDDFPRAIDTIVGGHDNHIDVNLLHDFLIETSEWWLKSKSSTSNPLDYYPCLMIVDELLDRLPWEMVLPEQEFSRIHSFDGLYKLFTKFKPNIENGNLYKRLEVGNVLLNPDASLPTMEQRLGGFFEYWAPQFNILRGKKLTSHESIDILTKCDLYCYAGHGSGLQFFRGNNIMSLDMKALVFLLGCSSVGLSSPGFDAMQIGAHHYYHLANCPTVLGMIFTVTDFDCDSVSASIISKFIPTKAKNDWNGINAKSWRNGVIEFTKSVKPKVQSNTSLQKIVASIRCNEDISKKMKMAIVVRGLPICNDI